MKRWWPGVGPVDTLAPGVYADVVGNIHFEVGEMIKSLGAEDTLENRRLMAEALTSASKRMGAHIRIEAGVRG